jgi:hypothetical protein
MSDTKAIPCSEAVRQLWDYLDHAISPEDQEKVEKHLSFCRKCCGELEFAKEMRGIPRDLVSGRDPVGCEGASRALRGRVVARWRRT